MDDAASLSRCTYYTAMTAKVIPMKPTNPASPASVNPPEGWKDGDGFGFMWGHDAQGQSVDLVRVVDLVRWLQGRDKLSCQQAIESVVYALPSTAMEWLYYLRSGDSAKLLPVDCSFQFSRPGRRVYSRGIDADGNKPQTLDQRSGLVVGRAGLDGLRALLASCGESVALLDNKGSQVAWLAIPRGKAFELWGWGTVNSAAVDATATSLQLVEAPSSANIDPPVAKPKAKEKVSLDWDSEETKDAFLAAFEAAPGGSNAKKLKYLASSGEWGVGDQRLKQRLQEIRDERGASKTQLPKVANSVFGLGNS